MPEHNIMFAFDIDADRGTVLAALTTQSGVTGWWTDQAKIPDTEGGRLELTFPDLPEPADMTLTKATPTHVEWEAGTMPPPWQGTRCVWTLSESDQGTHVDFAQRGFDEDNPAIGMVTFVWGLIMPRLKEHCETGDAVPFFVNG